MTFEQLCKKLELTPEDVAAYGGEPSTVSEPETVREPGKAEPIEERFARSMGLTAANFTTTQKNGYRLGRLNFS